MVFSIQKWAAEESRVSAKKAENKPINGDLSQVRGENRVGKSFHYPI
jgi:hypothetical protein